MWEIVAKLEAWPILQIGAVALIILLSGMTYMRVLASKFPVTPVPSGGGGNSPGEVSILYFQGWFKGVFDELNQVRSNQEMNRMQMKESIAEELSKTRHDIKNAVAVMKNDLEEKIRDEHKDTRQDIAELNETIEDMKKILVTIDERAARRVR